MKLKTQDEVDIRSILDDYMRLWMKGQSRACADLYDVSGDLLAVDGMFLQGRDEIKQYYDDVTSGKYAGFSVQNLSIVGIRALGQDAALLDAIWEIHAPSDTGSPSSLVASVKCSLVVLQTDQGWKISACRLMVPFQV